MHVVGYCTVGCWGMALINGELFAIFCSRIGCWVEYFAADCMVRVACLVGYTLRCSPYIAACS